MCRCCEAFASPELEGCVKGGAPAAEIVGTPPHFVAGLDADGQPVAAFYGVVRDANPGYQLLCLPSNCCPCFASWTMQTKTTLRARTVSSGPRSTLQVAIGGRVI